MIEVINPGPLMSIQDGGRPGYREIGVPHSGALDQYSYALANKIAGNRWDLPALEIVQRGAILKFTNPAQISLIGAVSKILINGIPVNPFDHFNIGKGDQLEISNVNHGLVTYLAVSGGIKCQHVLGSASTYITGNLGGLDGKPLKKGDLLECAKKQTMSQIKVLGHYKKNYPKTKVIRLMAGPEYEMIDVESRQIFESTTFKVSTNSNRMGIRLEGMPLHASQYDIPSRPLTRGTIQLTPSGPILLMNDCQATGGYPRVANVISADLDYCGQLSPGNIVRFRIKKLNEAIKLGEEYELVLDQIKKWDS